MASQKAIFEKNRKWLLDNGFRELPKEEGELGYGVRAIPYVKDLAGGGIQLIIYSIAGTQRFKARAYLKRGEGECFQMILDTDGNMAKQFISPGTAAQGIFHDALKALAYLKLRLVEALAGWEGGMQ